MPRHPFRPTASIETMFGRALRKVGRISGHIVDVHNHNGVIVNMKEMQKALKDYSELLEPWAQRQAEKMLEQVQKNNKRAYNNKSKDIKDILKGNLIQSEVNRAMRLLMEEQVKLIKSIPIRAAERAQQLSQEAVFSGGRATTIAPIIQKLDRQSDVSEAEAMCIARTEIARSNAIINQVRAEAVGATHYIWRAQMDEATRPAHRKMDGKVCSYNEPPHLSDGTTINPGEIYNCRCWSDPILPD